MGSNYAPPIAHVPRCEKCGSLKPMRAHHCSHCCKCYIRFDHHCPTVGSCIAYNNAQPFVVYLISGALILLTTGVVSFLAPLFECQLPRGLTVAVAAVLSILGMILGSFAITTFCSLWSDETTLERLYRDKMGHKHINTEDLDAIWGYKWYEWFYAHNPRVNGMIWAGCVPGKGLMI